MSRLLWSRLLRLAAWPASYWVLVRSVLPGLRLREAAVVKLGSTAVANTLPAGGALLVLVTAGREPNGRSGAVTTVTLAI
jgi:hypothetical protein